MSISPPVARTFRAAWLVFGAWLALSLPWLVFGAGCSTDPADRPHPETSQGEEFAEPEVEPPATGTAPDLTEPIDTNNPEERTPTVTAPPATPPPPPEGRE
jgi:hypothetical protein